MESTNKTQIPKIKSVDSQALENTSRTLKTEIEVKSSKMAGQGKEKKRQNNEKEPEAKKGI